MDAQRALLDELMGVSRDGERQEYAYRSTNQCVQSAYARTEAVARLTKSRPSLINLFCRVKRKFSDPEVCKYYIQGFCFMEEFQRTKHNYGDCDKEHDADCKQVSSFVDLCVTSRATLLLMYVIKHVPGCLSSNAGSLSAAPLICLTAGFTDAYKKMLINMSAGCLQSSMGSSGRQGEGKISL